MTARAGAEPLAVSNSSASFLVLLAEQLALPQTTLATANLYVHKYTRWSRDEHGPPGLDEYTLNLAALSLASKTTEKPRRFREFLACAWKMIHPEQEPLTIPSTEYDELRAGLVAAEMVLLRVLGFRARLPLPQDHLPRILDHVLSDTADDRGFLTIAAQRWLALATKDYRLATLYPPSTVSCAAVMLACKEAGLAVASPAAWSSQLREVDEEDLQDALEDFSSLK